MGPHEPLALFLRLYAWQVELGAWQKSVRGPALDGADDGEEWLTRKLRSTYDNIGARCQFDLQGGYGTGTNVHKELSKRIDITIQQLFLQELGVSAQELASTASSPQQRSIWQSMIARKHDAIAAGILKQLTPGAFDPKKQQARKRRQGASAEELARFDAWSIDDEMAKAKKEHQEKVDSVAEQFGADGARMQAEEKKLRDRPAQPKSLRPALCSARS